MKDILNRTVRIGDLIIMNDYHHPAFVIISHLSASGNMIGKWVSNKYTEELQSGQFMPASYIIFPYKPVILVPRNAIPDILIEDYDRIVNDPSFNKKKR